MVPISSVGPWRPSHRPIRPVPAGPASGCSNGPATLEFRLRAIRHKRAASRVFRATNLVAWIVGLGALVIVVAGGLLSFP